MTEENQELVEDETLDDQDEGQNDEGPSPEEIAAQEEAKKYGWRPKEEYDLAPDGWVDANRFLELPSTQNKMLRDELKGLRTERAQESEDFKQRLDRIDRANKIAMDAALAKQKQEHEAYVADLQKQQRQAAEDGDMQAYDRLERERLNVKPPEVPEIEEPKTPQRNPTVDAYLAANEWTKDPIIWETAVRATQTPENKDKTVEELLPLAEAAAKRYFPHMFQAQEQPKRQSRVDSGGLAGGGRPSSGKTAADLPAEARAAAKEFVEAGVFKTMDDYAKAYFEDQ